VDRKGLNRVNKKLPVVRFEDTGSRSGLKQLTHMLFAVMRHECQNLGARCARTNLTGDFDSIHQRERLINDSDMGSDRHRFRDGFLTVTSFIHHAPSFPQLKDGTQPGANHLMVVCDQNLEGD
jgi:hypothetical protein